MGHRLGSLLQTLEVDTIILDLSFSNARTSLNTNRGLLQIASGSPSVVTSRWNIPQSIFVKEQWISLGLENVLWLPLDYRPTHIAVRGGAVVLGHGFGQLSMLRLAAQVSRTCYPQGPLKMIV